MTRIFTITMVILCIIALPGALDNEPFAILIYMPFAICTGFMCIKFLIEILSENKKSRIREQIPEKHKEIEERLLELKSEIDAERRNNIEELLNKLIPLYEKYAPVIPTYKKRTLLVTNEERLNYYENLEKQAMEIFNLSRFSDIKDIIIKRGFNINITNMFQMNENHQKGYQYYNDKNDHFYNLIDEINQQYQDILIDYLNTKRGIDGEAYVNRILNDYYDVINLENIRLEIEDKQGKIQSVENDNILITRQGIFILEVKNYGSSGSYDLIIERDGRWVKRFPSGEVKSISNATGQNNRHVNYVSKFINESLGQDLDDLIPVYGLVIIPNDSISIDNKDPLQDVYRASQIYQFVMSKDVVLSRDKMQQIEILIKSHNLPPKSYPLVDCSEWFIQNIKFIQQQFDRYEILENKVHKLIDTYKKYDNDLDESYILKNNAILEEYPFYIVDSCVSGTEKVLSKSALQNRLFKEN